MLIFQMLFDINKTPNREAEIQFEQSSAWRCRDVYLSVPSSVAGWLSGHLVFTYDKGFLFDYQQSCSQQGGHSRFLFKKKKNLTVSELSWADKVTHLSSVTAGIGSSQPHPCDPELDRWGEKNNDSQMLLWWYYMPCVTSPQSYYHLCHLYLLQSSPES